MPSIGTDSKISKYNEQVNVEMDWLTKSRFTIDYYKAKERCIEQFCAQKIPEIIVQYPSIDAEKLSNQTTDFARAYFDMLDERCKKTDKIRKYAFSRVEHRIQKLDLTHPGIISRLSIIIAWQQQIALLLNAIPIREEFI